MSLDDSSISDLQPVAVDNYQVLSREYADVFPDLIQESSDEWCQLINQSQLVKIPQRTDIMNPASPCEQFFLILDGCVRVYQQTRDDREVTLYRLTPGDLCVLSINGLMRRKSYGAYATAETDLKCLMFSRDQFFQAMAISEVFRAYVLMSTTDRFNDMLELMETTVFQSLETRLVCMLGKMSRASSTDKIHITHQELARELGTSREVISRVLKGLERRGCINLARGAIQIKL